MSNGVIDKNDPRLAALLRRLEKASKVLEGLDVQASTTFNGQRFVTDKELSDILRVSRRTLQDYRAAGIIPYYLICGKILYMESEIQQYLETVRRRSIDGKELL